MKTSSAKAKGRNLQKYVMGKILEYFTELRTDDVTSRSMGAGGEDLLLSPRARDLLPYSFECKNHARFAIYKDYKQAVANASKYEPILVIKQNHSDPLAIIDLDYLLDLIKIGNTKNV